VKFTAKQEEAQRLLGSQAENIMLFGGSRSGKTFLLCRAILARAIKAPGSRHAILRFRYNAVVQSVALDTMPKVLRLCYPQIETRWQERPGYFRLENGSEIWLGGLDDKERTEKILGLEFATIFLNECSQIPWPSVGLVVTRLAQVAQTQIEDREPKQLARKMYYDCNPPSKAHWTYRLFIQGVDPETNLPLPANGRYKAMQMNPTDNLDNLPADYIDQTLKGLSARLQKRFLRGEFADATPNALFPEEHIERWRHLDGDLPEWQRIVVAVDPSGSGDTDNVDNDAIGILVVGLGTDGNCYVLEDCTVKAGPNTWGNIATTAFDRHRADVIVAETNFGGAMVQTVIQAARQRTPFKAVTASRGKVVRAEPFSSLYEQGKIRHVGYFRELEDELAGFSTLGYTGHGSPNRADALIWGLTELFPGMVNPRKQTKPQPIERLASAAAWMS
jgi:predicted phage terminase large subunit-like protein